MKYEKKQGFTLIEIMLVIALMIIIGGISVPVYQSFQVKNDLDVTAYTTAQTLRRAQALSQAGEGDSAWGVHIESGKVTLFKGGSFALRDVSMDESFEISESITTAGVQEIVYSKLTGEPQSIGNITFGTTNGEMQILSINKKGMIEY